MPGVPLRMTRRQAVAHRLRANHLERRLPPGSYLAAARHGIQDSAPRSALVSLHARVEGCEPSAWAAPGLIQTYCPRPAVYVLPVEDLGVFTIGTLPSDPAERAAIEAAADEVCAALRGREVRSTEIRFRDHLVRRASPTGRIALRWTASSLFFREIDPPLVDADEAALELCRRHVHAFAPTTPTAFAWWARREPADADRIWGRLAPELIEVDLEGHPAWALAADEPGLLAPPVRGVRLLPIEELRIFGLDRTGRFIAPMRRLVKEPPFDWFHSHGLLLDGELVGAWGRRGGEVRLRPAFPLAEEVLAAFEREALAMPIPGARMRVEIADPECPAGH
ncbi:MAG TPA: crosslink repair DNA glycosylase YcaQ family protein [Candidatus Dormibacteraeota bacterium]|jgi:hypothetical protein|nr:crosslink repair DNA glycosylase YcaQ family protein [Candidatus Dormibacteraeota bacterium]